MQITLPDKFLESMKTLLGGEYEAWLASYESAPHQGLRINRTKLEPQDWEDGLSPFEINKVPWCSNGYYYPEEVRAAKHPYYYAGLYYIQEPSAMAPAELLPVEPGDAVLDLCAAPGGKSTELGAKLYGEGLLVSNDISSTRARALLKNLELFGIPNICVTSESPEKLADTFGMFFDKILVDAPCSGEGMFRKDPELIKSWLERGSEYYAPLQREILAQAVRMLKPGGYLLYSTCTFARTEDEDTVEWLLNTQPDMILEKTIRMFPHKVQGEGHFLALMRRQLPGMTDAAATDGVNAIDITSKEDLAVRKMISDSDFSAWEAKLKSPLDRSRMMVKDQMVYYLPKLFDRNWGLRYLRTGLLLGEWKKTRFEPSQALAMVLQQREFANSISFSCEDERTLRYLKGETIALTAKEQGETEKGWCLVCVDGFPLGWAKCTGGTLKNKYYPGWRWQ